MLAEVKSLWQKVGVQLAAWNDCELAQPGNSPDLASVFHGIVILTTSDRNATGPFQQDVTIPLFFDKFVHATYHVTSFPAIVVGPFPVPGGSNTTTITMKGTGTGTFDSKTGLMTLTIALHFHESNLFAGDSDITFSLSTENKNPNGSRMNAAGNVALTGSAVFQGGFLGGDVGTLQTIGTVTPHP